MPFLGIFTKERLQGRAFCCLYICWQERASVRVALTLLQRRLASCAGDPQGSSLLWDRAQSQRTELTQWDCQAPSKPGRRSKSG